MSLSVAQVPSACMHCGNEIAVLIRTSLPSSTPNLEIQLSILYEPVYNSGTSEVLVSQRLKPDADGYCRFVINRFLKDAFENAFDLPAAGGTGSYTPMHAIKRYNLIAIEFSGDPQAATHFLLSGSNLNDTRFAVNGAIAESKFAIRSYFNSNGWQQIATNLGGLGKSFLDWRGKNPRTRVTDDQWLHWMYQANFVLDGSTNKLVYTVKTYRSDGATAQISVVNNIALDKYSVIGLPAGFTQLGLDALETPTEKIYKYETWMYQVIGGSTIISSEVKTWEVDRDYYEFAIQLQYINSIGFPEQLTLRGVQVETFSIDKDVVQSYRDGSYHRTVGETLVINTVVQNGMMALSGAMTESEARQLTDLRASRKVTLLSNDAGEPNMPIRVKGGSVKLDPLTNVYNYELEIAQDFEDSVPDML